jgi:hypothetical protein
MSGGYVVCNSHRAREKLFRAVGHRYGFNLAWTGKDIRHHGIYEVTDAEMPRALTIKGVRRLASHRVPHLSPCWRFD